MQLTATYNRAAIMQYAWATYKDGFFATIGEAIKYAWAIARQQVRDELREICAIVAERLTSARDNAVKVTRKVLGIVREFVLSSAQVGEVTVSPDACGEVTQGFAIACNRRDVYEGNGKQRQKRSSYLRPAMNAAILNNIIKEYKGC